jgi:hypothetical protein
MRLKLPIFLAVAALLACQRNQLHTVLPPGARVDVFPQLQQPQLDTLFVVDNSRFMGSIEARIAQSFHNFADYLDQNQMDYHLGLVTAQVNPDGPVIFFGGGSKQYIASSDGNASSAMAAAVVALGTSGGDISAVLQQADLALRDPPPGFLRAGAALFIVLVTDNGDPWSPPAFTNPPFDDANLFYYRSFKQAKGLGNDGLVRFATVSGPLPDGCTIPDLSNPSGTFAGQPSGRLIALAQQMGGTSQNICNPDFGQVFDTLGAVGAGLKSVFRLSQAPDAASLAITVRAPCNANPATLSACASIDNQCGDSSPALVCTPKQQAVDGWTFDPQTLSIAFNGKAIPPRGSEVDVQYQGSGQ